MNEKELYEKGMEIYREHSEEICVRVMKSRNEHKGNFRYLEDDDIKREQNLATVLKILLYKLYLKLEGKEDKKGYCSKICIECTYARYHFMSERAPNHWCNDHEPESWYCQAECECK